MQTKPFQLISCGRISQSLNIPWQSNACFLFSRVMDDAAIQQKRNPPLAAGFFTKSHAVMGGKFFFPHAQLVCIFAGLLEVEGTKHSASERAAN